MVTIINLIHLKVAKRVDLKSSHHKKKQFLFLFFFWWCLRHAEVPGQGSNQCHISGLSHSSDNAGSLTEPPGNSIKTICNYVW